MSRHSELQACNTDLAMQAKDIMQTDIVWGSSDDNVEQTLTKMQQNDTGYVMIGHDKIPEGIVSRSDLTTLLSPYLRPEFAKWRKPSDDASLKIRIKWIMSSPVNTINMETPLSEIMEIMCQYSQRAMPVVDQQGRVQGLVTVFEVFNGILKHFKPE
jgi:CBS domain-containing membrane protein